MVILTEYFSNQAYYQFFKALANRTNLAIIDILNKEPKTLLEISKELKQEQTTVSTNIVQLERSALICSCELKQEKMYSLNKETIAPISEILEFHTSKYCPGLKECIPPGKVKKYLKSKAAEKLYIAH